MHFATIAFTALQNTEVDLSGRINKFLENTVAQNPIGDAIPVGGSRDIVAGDYDASGPPARRRLESRRLSSCDDPTKESIRGNTNADCEFSVGDVSY